jgi:hypothetical protein
MGPSAESQTVAGEIPNAAPLANEELTDGKASKKINGAFTLGFVLF